jgi:hypothetical protein
MAKLTWTVAKGEGGKMLRRKEEGDALFDLDHIDVEWTCDEPFPEDTMIVPITHPPDIQYETRTCGRRDVIKDQVSVRPEVADSTVAAMLDEKRPKLAAALGIKLS